MNGKDGYAVRFIVRLAFMLAAVFLLLFLVNLRSRIYFHGPNYRFLLYMFAYCALTGFGMWKRKRWALLLLFGPGLAMAFIFIYASPKANWVPMPVAILNCGIIAAVLGVPVYLLGHWRDFGW